MKSNSDSVLTLFPQHPNMEPHVPLYYPLCFTQHDSISYTAGSSWKRRKKSQKRRRGESKCAKPVNKCRAQRKKYHLSRV